MDAKELLAIPLNTDNYHAMMQQLVEAEACGVQVSLKHREAEEKLADARGRMYNPSLATELYRKIDIERQTREQQRAADELADLADLIKRRVSLGQTLVKSHSTEMQTGLR